jgi:hypothetical protein
MVRGMRGLKHTTPVVMSALVLIALLAVYWMSHTKTDEQRWSELPHFARVAAVSRQWHVQPLAAHYQKRYDVAERALTASGYLVEIAVPVRSSRTRCWQIAGVITNTTWPNAASRWILDYGKDEVRLTCRSNDVSLWREALKAYQNP